MGSSNDIKKSIYKTLAYADIFDYPLTQEEIWKFFISSNGVSKDMFVRELLHTPFIFQENGFFCLPGKKACIAKRMRAKVLSKRKYAIAVGVAGILYKIPTILLIGLTGGLSMENVLENDDIDICILVKKNTLWITRLSILLVLQLLGMRHRQNVSDAICVNLFIDEKGMGISKQKQNMYTAHEVVQMKPIFDRNNTYKKFIAANTWVSAFLPNSLEITREEDTDTNKNKHYTFVASQLCIIFLLCLDWFAKKVQLWYWYIRKMEKVTEGISDHVLALFPANYSAKVIRMYNDRVGWYKRYEHI